VKRSYRVSDTLTHFTSTSRLIHLICIHNYCNIPAASIVIVNIIDAPFALQMCRISGHVSVVQDLYSILDASIVLSHYALCKIYSLCILTSV